LVQFLIFQNRSRFQKQNQTHKYGSNLNYHVLIFFFSLQCMGLGFNTHETLGWVRVAPAGQNIHPYSHQSGQVPIGFRVCELKLLSLHIPHHTYTLVSVQYIQ
jgi:hypothetical protein